MRREEFGWWKWKYKVEGRKEDLLSRMDGQGEKGLPGEDVYDRASWRRMSSHIDLT